jgi:nicotinamidase-related amidase/quinol monooxygenase YgiN
MKILPPLAVLVVDLTNGFTDPAEPLGFELGAVVTRTNELTAWAREREVPVYWTILTSGNGAWERKLPGIGALAPGSRAVELDPRLVREQAEDVVYRTSASAFAGTDLVTRLQGVRTLIVVGATTSGCVRASVVDALALGFTPVVVSDAVGDRFEPAHEGSLADLTFKYAEVLTFGELVDRMKGGDGVFLFHYDLRVRPGTGDAFVAAFQSWDHGGHNPMHENPALVEAGVLYRDDEDPDHFMLAGTWSSRDAHREALAGLKRDAPPWMNEFFDGPDAFRPRYFSIEG